MLEAIRRPEEIPDVVVSEESGEGTPGGTLAEDLDHGSAGGGLAGWRDRSAIGAGYRVVDRSRPSQELQPRKQPQRTGDAEHNEEKSPADMGYEHSAEKCSDGGTGGLPSRNERVGAAALQLRKITGDDFAVRGIGNRLADAKDEAHGEQQLETVDEASGDGGGGPQKNSECEDPVDGKAVNQPAGNDLKDRVGPEERSEEDPEMGIGKAEFVFDMRRRDGEIPAIDVVDENGEGEEQRETRELGRKPGRRLRRADSARSRGHYGGASVC